MERYKSLFAFVGLWTIGLFDGQVNAQASKDYASYVVIGAFEMRSNAEAFSYVNAGKGLNPQVRKNSFNDLFYVYTYQSDDVEASRTEVFKTRDQFPELSDTWLYNGDFAGPHIPSEDFTSEFSPKLAAKEEVITQKVEEPIEVIKEELKSEPQIEKKEGVYNFYFNARNVTNSSRVTGDIQLHDAERNKLITTYKSHKAVEVREPKNGTNRVKLVTDIFGFRPVEHVFDLDELETMSSESFINQGDSTIVDFELVRFNKGDIMTMWRVFFYIDAAIMKEESVPQLNELLGMMQDNEKMRIRIHGHTNGNSKGKVMHLDLDDKNFFSLNGTHKEAVASAKKLSLYRAYTIQHWLIDQGIAENRMEIQGWGGKKMLYDKHSSQADKNVRVEIEILEE